MLAISDSDKRELFQKHLSNIFQPHTDIIDLQYSNRVNTFLNTPIPESQLEKFVTPNEVKFAISKYPNNKSTGYDLITGEVAKCLPKKAIVFLTYIINSIIRLSYFPML